MVKEIKLGYVSVYLVGEKNYVLVDTGIVGSHDKIIQALQGVGISPKDIKLIVLTHFHEDHIGSAKELRETTGAKIIMHRLDADTLKGTVAPEIKALAWWIKIVYFFTKGKQKLLPLVPDLVFEGDYDLKKFGVDAKLVETPGHTKGSISLITGNQAVVGDTYMAFKKEKGIHMPFIAYDSQLIRTSMEGLVNMGIRTIYLGHGGKFSMTVL